MTKYDWTMKGNRLQDKVDTMWHSVGRVGNIVLLLF